MTLIYKYFVNEIHINDTKKKIFSMIRHTNDIKPNKILFWNVSEENCSPYHFDIIDFPLEHKFIVEYHFCLMMNIEEQLVDNKRYQKQRSGFI